MSMYELTDANGRRLRIVLGWGSVVCNQANLFGNSFAAKAFIEALAPDTRHAISKQFMDAFRDPPRHIKAPLAAPIFGARCDPNKTHLTPDAKLTRAIANSELVVKPDDSLTPVDDNRTELRMKIRMQLNTLLADERREAAVYQAQMEQESTLSKGLIYTGAFFQGLGTAAWDTLKWAKEVSDLGNPVVQLRNLYTSAYKALDEDQKLEAFATNMQAAHRREIAEALGFDPSQITPEMLAQAMDAADVVWEDKTLRQDLTNFAWDYVKAQHAVELAQMGGGAALEIVITAILAALTAGAGLAAATAAKARHLPKLRKLGDLLLEFVEQSKKLGRYLKEKAKRAAKGEKGKPLDAEPVVERVNEPPRGVKHQDVDFDWDSPKSVSYDDFKKSVAEFKDGGQDAQLAYELFQQKKWSELEQLFNEKGLNGGWPPNGGAISSKVITISPPKEVDRFGGYYENGQFKDSGKYIADLGADFESRALPSDTLEKPLKGYRVLKPIPQVKAGKAIPWFGQKGGGMQYELPLGMDKLVKNGYLEVIE